MTERVCLPNDAVDPSKCDSNDIVRQALSLTVLLGSALLLKINSRQHISAISPPMSSLTRITKRSGPRLLSSPHPVDHGILHAAVRGFHSLP